MRDGGRDHRRMELRIKGKEESDDEIRREKYSNSQLSIHDSTVTRRTR